MTRARTAIMVGVSLLVSSQAVAQSVEGSCFRVEMTSLRWEAGDLETTAIQEPSSELFGAVTQQLVMLTVGGQIAGLDGRVEGGPATTGDWRLEGDSLSLEWERAPDRVWGSLQWSSGEEFWLGTLQDGTVDGKKGHWSANVRLRTVRCPSRPAPSSAKGRPAEN